MKKKAVKKLTVLDKKNIKLFVETWLEIHKKEADYFVKWKLENVPKVEKDAKFKLTMSVPRELSDLLTKEYPDVFEETNRDWFKKTFEIFTR